MGAPLYIISAGLGLVPSQLTVPAYGLTVGGRGPDAISSRVRGSFDVGAWWASVERGPYSVPLLSIFDRAGLVLGALTQPYAKMLAPCLDALSDELLARVRLFGAGLSTILPLRLRPALMPYDVRLQALLPGTQADFPQRALSHFVASVAHSRPAGGPGEHQQAVLAALSEARVPTRLKRPRLSDSEMLKVITAKLGNGSRGIQRTLRALRDEDKIACEQARFSRLYRLALEQRVAS
ncbi:hypothetical protein J4558_06300 [Leptolyngbya sp. 15MV]|nr:hypothetical protein J4558_06300 [Leptolyngbya sp. 15MV]